MPHDILTLTGPQSIVAAVPYLVGFLPEESLVLLITKDDELRLTMRVDLASDGEREAWARLVAGQGPVGGSDAALAVIYTEVMDVEQARHHADAIQAALAEVGVGILDRLLVRQGRFRSFDCHDPECCPEEGRAVEEARCDPAAARFVMAGRGYVASRESLRQSLQPIGDALSGEVAQQLSTEPPADTSWRESRQVENAAVKVAQRRQADLVASDIVTLALACADVYSRDPMLARVMAGRGRGTTSPVCERFVQASRHCPGIWRANLLAVAALTAWADGDGARAAVAAEEALAEYPQQSLAGLVQHALSMGLPPETWMDLTRDIPFDVLRGRGRRVA